MRKLIAAMCAASVVLIPGCSRGEPNSLFDAAGYHVRGDTVYYLQAFPGTADEIQGVDVDSFEALDRTYAKDAAHVYLDGRPLADADPATFVLLDRSNYAKDARHVYARDRVVSDDPAYFEIVSTRDYYTYTKDRTTVHVNGTPIDGADPATFRVLAGGYSRDDAGAFYFTDAMPEENPADLEVLEGAYARDRAHAYWMGKPIPGADAASFVVLNSDFECAADATRAFYRDALIAGANPVAFPKGKAVTGCSETGITFLE